MSRDVLLNTTVARTFLKVKNRIEACFSRYAQDLLRYIIIVREHVRSVVFERAKFNLKPLVVCARIVSD